MSNPEDFPRLLSLLGRENDIIWLARGDATTFTTTPIPFANILPAMEALSRGKWNVWFEVNRSLYQGNSGRSSAGHITRLNALWADLDFKDNGLGSLDGAMAVVDDLSNALGLGPSAIVHTGHGIQPYWPVTDGDLTDDTRDDAATLLKRWGLLVQQFAANNHGAADSIFDLPRILRAPGSVNWKAPEKPVETRTEFFDGIAAVDLPWLREVLDEYGITAPDSEVSAEVASAIADWDWAGTDCSFASNALFEIATSVPTARHQWALKWSGIIFGMVRNTCITEAGFYTLRTALSDRFQQLLAAESSPRPFSAREFDSILKQGQRWAESWSGAKLSEELRRHTHDADFAELTEQAPGIPTRLTQDYTPVYRQMAEQGDATLATVSSIFTKQAFSPLGSMPETNGGLALAVAADVKSQQRLAVASLTDTGNAERLSMWLRGKFIFVPGIGWHEWDGNRYLLDAQGHVAEATKDMFINLRANATPDSAQAKWAQRSLMQGAMRAAIDLCKTVPHLVVDPLNLDSKAYELNTPAGIVDLYTGAMRDSDPQKDFHTFTTGQTPAVMPIPKFLAFLSWAMGEELVDGQPAAYGRLEYLQTVFGIAAVGKLRWHCFPIFIGVGANGKTTLLDICAGALGQYAAVMPPKFLIEKRSEPHETTIAQLRGVRLAICSEVPPSARFDEELVKRLTGETRLKARRMNENHFEFENTSTIFLAANHLPQVTSGGVSFWRRARKINFDNQMPTAQQNDQLVIELLREEGPGILQWIIDGAARVLKTGEHVPDGVLLATKEYQNEEDSIARFITECILDIEGSSAPKDRVYDVYKVWMTRQSLVPLSAPKFNREMLLAKPRANLGRGVEYSNLQLSPMSAQYGGSYGGFAGGAL